jgi:hypothetical protein
VIKRRRIKQTSSLRDRLAALASAMREKADRAKNERRTRKPARARQAETALHIDDWANSPGLPPPK